LLSGRSSEDIAMPTDDDIRFLRGKITDLERDLKRLTASAAPIGPLNHLSQRVAVLEEKATKNK
jgi:hypothetical protein